MHFRYVCLAIRAKLECTWKGEVLGNGKIVGDEIEVPREGMSELQARITHFSIEEKPAGWKEKHSQPLPLLLYHFCSISFEILFRVKLFLLLFVEALKLEQVTVFY